MVKVHSVCFGLVCLCELHPNCTRHNVILSCAQGKLCAASTLAGGEESRIYMNLVAVTGESNPETNERRRSGLVYSHLWLV